MKPVRLIAGCVALSAATAVAQEDGSWQLGPPVVVPVPANPIFYYANDSRFPFLPNSNGTANITFWVDGVNFRSMGKSLDTMRPIEPTNSVLSGVKGEFDNGGIWLLNAIRRPDGVIVGFYHAEDHGCSPYTEWNSTGVALSTNDGASFKRLGQIIGSPNPCKGNGGIGATTVVWDHAAKRWLAWGGANAFESRDPDAAPGTWRGYDTNGAFTVTMPCTDARQLGRLPGLDGHCSSQAATWNTALRRYLMLCTRWGDTRNIHVATSTNGIAWTGGRTLLTGAPGEYISYPLIIGTTAEESGTDALVVYERSPATQPGRSRDMIQRTIRFIAP